MDLRMTTLLAAILCVVATAPNPHEAKNLCPQGLNAPLLLYGDPDNCTQYFICAHGRNHLISCPDGKHFSNVSKVCVPPHSYFDTCAPNLHEAKNLCPQGINAPLFLYGDPDNCTQYFFCVQGRNNPRSCPEGKHFNNVSKVCVPAHSHFDTCVPNPYEAKNLCPQDPNALAFLYGDPDNCTQYFFCVQGRNNLRSCPDGKHFSNVSKTCVPPHSHFDSCAPNPYQAKNLCPQGPNATEFVYADPDDCTRYFTCAHGRNHPGSCPHGKRFSNVYKTCVTSYSYFDTCAQENALKECENGYKGLIAHPTICHRYYNCTKIYRHPQSFLGPYDRECDFPKVFDVLRQECLPFKQAFCGLNRTAGKNGCDYVQNLCPVSHCVPCSIMFTNCDGLADGYHRHRVGGFPRQYMLCEDERVLQEAYCSPATFFLPRLARCIPWPYFSSDCADDEIFSPVLRKCISDKYYNDGCSLSQFYSSTENKCLSYDHFEDK
ncbi:peritrophin-48 [Plakobranchus ocellatus]|uniref:Peritrophin-48 n=1 Tax=Plakobranchus ocellatus TaxID=259542 RepID=A0AAV4D2E8_9GAST|nr:peritrophin-48 [Plakobranchus ocellatus]